MKANEMMTMDWVMPLQKRFRGIPGQVVTIDGGTDICWIDCDDYSGLIPCGDVEGIPITPEILEKNGFTDGEYRHYCGFVWKYEADGFRKIGFTQKARYWVLLGEKIKNDYPNAVGDDFSITNIHYVHELQHALRLCGIDKEIIV